MSIGIIPRPDEGTDAITGAGHDIVERCLADARPDEPPRPGSNRPGSNDRAAADG